MKDTELYAALLKLHHPWHVREVKLDLAAERIDVWLEHAEGVKWACPECGKTAPVYDHADEREWRHLDTCECQTFLHARLPRVNCPQHGIRQAQPGWANPGSQFTLGFQGQVIRHVEGVRRYRGLASDRDELGRGLGDHAQGRRAWSGPEGTPAAPVPGH